MNEDIEAEATAMGWLPKEKFHGKNWVEAEKYVQKGKEFIPFLQATNRKLTEKLEATSAEVATLKNTLQQATETLEAFKEFKSEFTKEKLETAKGDLVEGIKKAREDGNVEAEVELQTKLNETTQALKAPVVKEPAPAPQSADFSQTPEWKQFVEENPWWNSNGRMRAVAVEIGREFSTDPNFVVLKPAERFAKIAAETKALFAKEAPRESKVANSRSSASSDSGSVTFESLRLRSKKLLRGLNLALWATNPGNSKISRRIVKIMPKFIMRGIPNGR